MTSHHRMTMFAAASQLPSYNTDLLANVFDALPAPALVVDRNIRIIDFNVQAARLMERVPFAVLRPSAGEALACIHATESPEGCNHGEACYGCPICNSVHEALETGRACRRHAHMELARDGKTIAVDLLVSAAPIPDEPEPVALLMLEDTAELSGLLVSPVSSSPDSKAHAKARGHKTGNS